MQRYKDSDPKETVDRIKGILDGLNIHPEGELLNFADCFFSMRITDPATGLGTNGKGASPELAWASAYGEFMERLQGDFMLQSKISWSRTIDESTDDSEHFKFWPDERSMATDDALKACPDVVRDMEQNYIPGGIFGDARASNASAEDAMKFWKPLIGDTTSMVPYYCVGTNSLVDLPEEVIRKLGMSNGLASGNTPEEALVEGMSELCERYAKAMIVNHELCPPSIPRDFIEKHCPDQAEMLRIIEERSPKLNIVILDGSLGKGIPTACMLFIDQSKGEIRPKFGSHPTLAIALERCMTEQYQGYSPDSKSVDEQVFLPWDEWTRRVVHFTPIASSAFTSDRYIVPDRMLSGNPDWEFEPWGIEDGYANKYGARRLADLLREIGGEVYIRSQGYLGVPSYRVYVPEVASVPTPGGEEILLAEKHGIITASAIIACDRGDLRLAASLLQNVDKKRYRCAAQELLCRDEGIPEEERDALLEAYFGAGTAAYVKAVWRSDDIGHAMDVFEKRENWLKTLGAKKRTEGGPRSQACREVLNELRQRKAANPLDQMSISEIFK